MMRIRKPKHPSHNDSSQSTKKGIVGIGFMFGINVDSSTGQPYFRVTDGNRPTSVCGRNLAALKRFMKSWLTLSSR